MFTDNISKENTEELKYKVRAAIQVCDKGQIIHESYKNSTLISHDLPREWKVFAERKEITYKMNEIILNSLVNIVSLLSDNSLNSEVHINDTEIIDNISQINILKYLIPDLVKKKVLNTTNPKIHLRISGNGRNIGRKVKQVMVTCSILNDIDNLHRPENHYTIVLYPGIEKYETLHIILDPLIVELRKLKEEELKDDQGIK
ncbi:hypothetical protein C1646_752361 [Rhizophagus diaphanus]|nr:hypothetical protein C1646_752361 [Rhizophagus diaphanus] [Rhizophagus sp. MUCL 43196]